MGTSRLDRGLRALAWIALAATVAALLAAGALVQAAQEPSENNDTKAEIIDPAGGTAE